MATVRRRRVALACIAACASTGIVRSSYEADFDEEELQTDVRIHTLEQISSSGEGEAPTLPKISGMLSTLHDERVKQLAQQTDRTSSNANSPTPFSSEDFLIIRDDTHVLIEAVAAPGGGTDDLLDELGPLGFEAEDSYGRILSGWAPVDSIEEMSRVGSMQFASPAVPPRTNVGSVQSEGVRSMMADVAWDRFGVDGAGVTVGVISDSFNCSGGADLDLETGDLPMGHGLVILNDTCKSWHEDEGRAMMQLIHDVAPKARLVFHTVGSSQASFANAILNLAFDNKSKVDIIVDDIGILNEPIFQDGIISQAIDEVAKQGVAYFCAAGNMGQKSWESDAGFIPMSVSFTNYKLHNFNTGTSLPRYYQEIGIPAGVSSFVLVFQWDEPALSASSPASSSMGSSSDVDVVVWDENDKLLRGLRPNTNNTGGDPVEVVIVEWEEYERPTQLYIAFVLRQGRPPSYLKYVVWDPSSSSIVDYPTSSGSCIGHAYARGGASLGAAAWSRTPAYGISPPMRTTYSSPCGFPVLFDIDGKRLGKPEYRQRPTLTGPDGGQTTFFGRNIGGKRYFTGTSAAAPHVAAVAALMLQSSGKRLKPSVLYRLLEETATDMGTPGFDFLTGHGFVNAELAIARATRFNSRERLGEVQALDTTRG
eukprot:CAMPEP_0113532998 /NCGR_PEP_ID=MMETSP0015_2-20120614/4361_1 /TAXON_ID=2838 /ORGANISM="Odontella" /LENGTH=650 /DNA_ID=CAMNT_0000432003 /DNA_START=159 /DNA_END=2112 /DNA_ORIENTATION=+ /assembly_acc=CAM_ASM_000160